uniref:Uncharacterized protein n=1 Tax=Oryza glumipatula TaxID=40148 RepID=A0A0E0A4V9_9ORYZ
MIACEYHRDKISDKHLLQLCKCIEATRVDRCNSCKFIEFSVPYSEEQRHFKAEDLLFSEENH